MATRQSKRQAEMPHPPPLPPSRQRRTSAQVAANKKAAANKKTHAAKKVALTTAQTAAEIACYEDALHQEDIQRAQVAARPDIILAQEKNATKGSKQPVRKKATKSNQVESNNQPAITADDSLDGVPQVALGLDLEDVDIPPPMSPSDFSTSDGFDMQLDALEEPNDGEQENEEQAREQDVSEGEEQDSVDSQSEYEDAEPEDALDNEEHYDEDQIIAEQRHPQATANTCQKKLKANMSSVAPPVSKNAVPQVKVKGNKRTFEIRKQVENARSTTPASGAQPAPIRKRKVLETDTRIGSHSDRKRSKGLDSATGLLADWQKTLNNRRKAEIKERNAQNAHANHQSDDEESSVSSSESEQDRDPQEYAGGEFDQDESQEYIEKARNSKAAHVKMGTTQMSVKVSQKPPVILERTPSGRHRVRKPKYHVTSLPFPGGGKNIPFHQKWRGVFKASLIYWAGVQADPFAVNGILEPFVYQLWCTVYPSLSSVVQQPGEDRDIILQLAGDVLIDWRSAMGKEGIKLVLSFIRNDMKADLESVADAAKYLKADFRFIYPGEVGKRGLQSSLVMQSFAFHFKKTLHFLRVDGVEYGDQCGGLALSVAALERGLDLIISGDVSPTGMKAVTNTDSKKKRSLAFAEANWGKKVRKWVETALLLKPEHWSRIQNGAVDILAASMGELGSSEAEEDIATDPRLMIGLDD